MTEVGIVIVSHSKWIAQGLVDLISEVAKDIVLTYVGGTEDGGIGTSFEQVQTVVEANKAEKILAGQMNRLSRSQKEPRLNSQKQRDIEE